MDNDGESDALAVVAKASTINIDLLFMQMVVATFVYFNMMCPDAAKFIICIIGEVCCLFSLF